MLSGPHAKGVARAAGATRAAGAALMLLVGGCSHLPAMHWPQWHWPWHHKAPPAAAPVHELDISAGEVAAASAALGVGASGAGASGVAAAYPQHWKRNTLVVDLSSASGSGAITLKPAAGSAWPVRLAFRVTPGSIGLLSVRADQRLVMPITPGAGKPIELELAPRMYTSKTPQMVVSWGPNNPPES